MSLPSFASVTWSAFRAGSCTLVTWRSSAHSRSRRVAEAFFASQASAWSFARRWAVRLGIAVAVRRARSGWSVSVPVAAWVAIAGAGAVIVRGPAGGVRGVARGVRSASLTVGQVV